MKVKDILEIIDNCVDIAIISNENTINDFFTDNKKNIDIKWLNEEIDNIYIIKNSLIIELKY